MKPEAEASGYLGWGVPQALWLGLDYASGFVAWLGLDWIGSGFEVCSGFEAYLRLRRLVV